MALAQGLSASDFLPRAFYRIEVIGLAVLDLRSGESLTRAGLSERALALADWTDCQAVAEAAHLLGAQGIVAPSATGIGLVVAAFDDRLESRLVVRDLEVVALAE